MKKTALELLTLARSVGQPQRCSSVTASTMRLPRWPNTAGEHLRGRCCRTHRTRGCSKAELFCAAGRREVAGRGVDHPTAEGKEIAGRLAIKINSGVITDAVGISEDLVANQSIFGGSTIVHSKVTTERRSSRCA